VSTEWTEKHRLEARAACYRLAAERALAGLPPSGLLTGHVRDVVGFMATLERAGLDAKRVVREVRRVRALAEGRLVRETLVRVVDDDMICGEGRSRGEARQHAAFRGYSLADVRIVRVTRIRRARGDL